MGRAIIGTIGVGLCAALIMLPTHASAQPMDPDTGQPAAVQPVNPQPANTQPAAGGGGGSYASQVSKRPLTLPPGFLRLDGTSNYSGVGDATSMSLGLGAAFGIIDGLEVSSRLAYLNLSPEIAFNDIQVGATYRFMSDKAMEAGAQLNVTVPIEGDLQINVGTPVKVSMGTNMRLDTGAFFNVAFSDPAGLGITHTSGVFGAPTQGDAGIPLLWTMSINDAVFFGVRSGLSIGTFDDIGGSLTLPLGAHGGYTIKSNTGAPMMDIIGSFEFPSFYMDGANMDIWALNAGVQFYMGN